MLKDRAIDINDELDLHVHAHVTHPAEPFQSATKSRVRLMIDGSLQYASFASNRSTSTAGAMV